VGDSWRIWGRFVANLGQIRGESGGDSWRIMRFSKACITFLAWRIRGESGADSWRIRGRFFGVRDFLAFAIFLLQASSLLVGPSPLGSRVDSRPPTE
jgi:hypothetical protein